MWNLTPAGYWYVFVSVPVFQFILLARGQLYQGPYVHGTLIIRRLAKIVKGLSKCEPKCLGAVLEYLAAGNAL